MCGLYLSSGIEALKSRNIFLQYYLLSVWSKYCNKYPRGGRKLQHCMQNSCWSWGLMWDDLLCWPMSMAHPCGLSSDFLELWDQRAFLSNNNQFEAETQENHKNHDDLWQCIWKKRREKNCHRATHACREYWCNHCIISPPPPPQLTLQNDYYATQRTWPGVISIAL